MTQLSQLNYEKFYNYQTFPSQFIMGVDIQCKYEFKYKQLLKSTKLQCVKALYLRLDFAQ